MATTVEERLQELGVALPAPSTPVANYVPAVRFGNLLFVAGHISRTPDGGVLVGKLGQSMTVEEGYQAARSVVPGILASVKVVLGDLEKVRRVLRVFGMVNSTPDFQGHPEVMNGASDLLVEVFGERGRHARCAVGMSSLPRSGAVEIEVVLEVAD